MAARNEIATNDTLKQFSTALTQALEEQHEALPDRFNTVRFVNNSIALLNGRDELYNFAKQHGTAQIKAGLLRGAYLGLDAMNQEMYLIPYGSQLNFMPSYKGMVKLATTYATRPIKSIYAKCVREGDVFEEVIVNGEPTINFKPIPFNSAPVIGVFAVCLYKDGGIQYEVMSRDEVEQCRKSSKANNSPAWKSYWTEMAKKTVIRRLAKSLPIDMDAKAVEAFNAGTEMETDAKILAEREREEKANAEEFIVDMEIEEEDF